MAIPRPIKEAATDGVAPLPIQGIITLTRSAPPIMNQHPTTDDRGIVLPCPRCGTANRLAYPRLAQQGRCGSCQAELPALAQPVEASDAASFAALIAHCPLPVVVDFWAPWCGPCQMMAPEFAKAAAQAAGEAVFVKVNTDEQQDIARQFRIQGIPAFALFRDGQLIAQTAGFQPATALLAWMRQA
jgi:thioredoxin 2